MGDCIRSLSDHLNSPPHLVRVSSTRLQAVRQHPAPPSSLRTGFSALCCSCPHLSIRWWQPDLAFGAYPPMPSSTYSAICTACGKSSPSSHLSKGDKECPAFLPTSALFPAPAIGRNQSAECWCKRAQVQWNSLVTKNERDCVGAPRFLLAKRRRKSLFWSCWLDGVLPLRDFTFHRIRRQQIRHAGLLGDTNPSSCHVSEVRTSLCRQPRHVAGAQRPASGQQDTAEPSQWQACQYHQRFRYPTGNLHD